MPNLALIRQIAEVNTERSYIIGVWVQWSHWGVGHSEWLYCRDYGYYDVELPIGADFEIGVRFHAENPGDTDWVAGVTILPGWSGWTQEQCWYPWKSFLMQHIIEEDVTFPRQGKWLMPDSDMQLVRVKLWGSDYAFLFQTTPAPDRRLW